MSDEAKADDDEPEFVYSDSEHALAQYGSHAAEIAQAFGNLLTQAAQLPLSHPLYPIAAEMLTRLTHQIDPAPKGSRARLVKD